MTQLWIVGRYRCETEQGVAWDFRGIFDTQAAAIAACDNDYCFIGPVLLNQALPDEPTPGPGWYYPLQEDAP